MSTTSLRRLVSGMTFLAATLLGACGGDSGGPTDPGPGPDPDPLPIPSPSQGRAIFGLTCANQLVPFGSGNPGTLARQVTISGMPAGAAMVGMDCGGNGALYGVGSDSRVYTIDTLSGAASPVGGAFAPAVSGEHFGLTFADGDQLRLSGVESNPEPGSGGRHRRHRLGGRGAGLRRGGQSRGDGPGARGPGRARRHDLRGGDQRQHDPPSRRPPVS